MPTLDIFAAFKAAADFEAVMRTTAARFATRDDHPQNRDEGYRPGEALCLVCHLTFNRHLPQCPNTEDHR